MSGCVLHLLWTELIIKKEPSNKAETEVCNNLSPNHIDVWTLPWPSVSHSMLDCLPDRQKPKAECEPGSHRGYLDIRRRSHFPPSNKAATRSKTRIEDQTTKKLEELRPIGPVALYMYRGLRQTAGAGFKYLRVP